MNNIISTLNEFKNKLYGPFPYRDCARIQEDFRREFLRLSDEENCLNADYNTYCANITGTLSYVLKGKTAEITEGQIDIIHLSFFDCFLQYKFFESHITNYKEFNEQYLYHEEARKLLIQLVKE